MSILKNTKIIFMGTPDFSVPILNSSIQNYNVVAVVSQPDKKVGREQIVTPSPVKQFALKNKIEVLQPEKIKGNTEFMDRIKDLKSDVIVVAAYGFILPQEFLDISKYGVINVHASLLPKYRGASPIQAAILNGEKVTGITIMLVNAKMDEGDILAQAEIDIAHNDTFETLHDKLAVSGARLLINILPKYFDNEIKPQQQDDSKATYCKLITKDDGKIDWSKPAEEIERQVRAFNPWPGSWTIWNSKNLKVFKVNVIETELKKISEVFKYNEGLAVVCGKGALEIIELQLEGKKVMNAKDFINGSPNIIGSILK